MDITLENDIKELLPATLAKDENAVETTVQPKKTKKEERQYKKEEKSVEQFMKTLQSITSPDDKMATIAKRFTELTEENKKLSSHKKLSDKQLATVYKEKELLQYEYNKSILLKSKLENLCRELQKQNKAVKDESLMKIREEEERRKETQSKFQSTLNEITTMLQQNSDKNSKLREDNISMTKKFKSVVEQYELREEQVEKMSRQMELANQLADAKLAKAKLEAQAERERLMTQLSQLRLDVGQYQAKIMENQATEAALRGQIAMYVEKYDEFQGALVKSNQVFGGFKSEIDKMSKKTIKLEKECACWKERWEGSQGRLLEMAAERQMTDERAALLQRQLHQLQGLCRTMQAERTLLLNTLKENNIERPPLQQLPAPPPPPPPSAHTSLASDKKVDAMAANCAQLKQSLAQLQTQLNVLTNKNEDNPASKETGKNKKGKNKKNKRENDRKESSMESTINSSPPPTSVVANGKTNLNNDAISEMPLDIKTDLQDGKTDLQLVDKLKVTSNVKTGSPIDVNTDSSVNVISDSSSAINSVEANPQNVIGDVSIDVKTELPNVKTDLAVDVESDLQNVIGVSTNVKTDAQIFKTDLSVDVISDSQNCNTDSPTVVDKCPQNGIGHESPKETILQIDEKSKISETAVMTDFTPETS